MFSSYFVILVQPIDRSKSKGGQSEENNLQT